jgi:hypothetical protein
VEPVIPDPTDNATDHGERTPSDTLDEAASLSADEAAKAEIDDAGIEPPDEPTPWLLDEAAGAPIDPLDTAPTEAPVNDGANGHTAEPSMRALRIAAIAAGAADPRLDPVARKILRGALPATADQSTAPERSETPSEPRADAPRAYTIAEARQRVAEVIEYLPVLGYDGYFVKGWTHLLAGFWRLGKTEMMAAIILPWLRLRLRVLWITEEADSIWVDRADQIEETYPPVSWDGLRLVDAMSATPEALLDYAASAQADVLIVDTVREVCQITSMKDDDAVRSAVSPWLRRLRDGRRTLVFIAQHRKAAGERGERVEGSVALPSMMDVVLELEGVAGHDRQRRLTVRRRRAQTQPLTYEMDEDDRMVVIPDGRSRSRVEVEAAALTVVNASAEPMLTAEVRRRMVAKTSTDSVQRALKALAIEGRILRDPPIDRDAARRSVRWVALGLQTSSSTATSPTPISRDAAEALAVDASGRFSGPRAGVNPLATAVEATP